MPVKAGPSGVPSRRRPLWLQPVHHEHPARFEASHVPLHIWWQAAFLLCSSKKGISSNQLHRTLGVTLKTAWFMSHRLREAMRVLQMDPLGGADKDVEADETFIGNKRPKARNARGYAHKHAVVSLVERGGKVRSEHVNDVNAATLRPILKAQVDPASWLHTDESSVYRSIGKEFKYHFTVAHGAGEYVRGDAHTNTIEGFFSIFKRGMDISALQLHPSQAISGRVRFPV